MKQVTTHQDFIRDIQKTTGCQGYISWKKIAAYRGVSKNNNRERARLTFGCKYVADGRGKRYRVIDIAARMKELDQIEIERYE
ncbi:MAG: hypothetical protein ACI4LK_04560 [Lentihominibacter sp.]